MRSPVLIPSLGDRVDLDELLGRLDGILLTGSPSNVEPHRYAGPPSDPGTWHDPHRDDTTLPLIPQVVEAGLPLLGDLSRLPGDECRVRRHALAEGPGGARPARPPRGQGRSRSTCSTARRTRSSWCAGGVLQRLAGSERIMVNSLHSQGVQTARRDARDRSARPRRPGRRLPRAQCARLCARRAVASRVAGHAAIRFHVHCSPRSAMRRTHAARQERPHEYPDSAVLQGSRHLRSRGRRAGHGRHRARQGDARGQVRGRRGHAHAREHLPADGHGRVPGRRPRDQPVRDRHRAQGRPDDAACRAVGGGADRAGHSRLRSMATADRSRWRRATCCATCSTCTRSRAGSRSSRPSSSSSWSSPTSMPTIRSSRRSGARAVPRSAASRTASRRSTSSTRCSTTSTRSARRRRSRSTR